MKLFRWFSDGCKQRSRAQSVHGFSGGAAVRLGGSAESDTLHPSQSHLTPATPDADNLEPIFCKRCNEYHYVPNPCPNAPRR